MSAKQDPRLIQVANALLANPNYRMVIVQVVCADGHVHSVLLTHTFSDHACDVALKSSIDGLRRGLESVALLARQQREN